MCHLIITIIKLHILQPKISVSTHGNTGKNKDANNKKTIKRARKIE